LGATRIDHGIQVVYDVEVMESAEEKEISFEVCPTSNRLKITINDDDPETSQISLQSE